MEGKTKCECWKKGIWEKLHRDILTGSNMVLKHNASYYLSHYRMAHASSGLFTCIPWDSIEHNFYTNTPNIIEKKTEKGKTHAIKLIQTFCGKKQSGRFWKKILDRKTTHHR